MDWHGSDDDSDTTSSCRDQSPSTDESRDAHQWNGPVQPRRASPVDRGTVVGLVRVRLRATTSSVLRSPPP